MWTAKYLYELWAEIHDPSWFALSNAEHARWERIAWYLHAKHPTCASLSTVR
jgi:hypothetical protein